MTETTITEPHYAFDRFGELCFRNGPEPRRHGREALAIAYTTDDGVLYKHGPETGVRFHYERLRAVDPSAQLIVLPLETLRGPKGEAILAEINACLAISGRIAGIERRLSDLLADASVEASRGIATGNLDGSIRQSDDHAQRFFEPK